MSQIFETIPHPRIAARRQAGPPKVADVIRPPETARWTTRFNAALAVKITKGVGTMACAYVFTIIALIGLPQALKDSTVGGTFHPLPIVQWVAQTFLQLVLLSIIIVGQNVLAAAADKRAEATYEDADAVLHTSMAIQQHLAAQDAEIEKILSEVRAQKSS
jgi:hypothetical protein